MAFVGQAWVQISPSFEGLQRAIQKELSDQMGAAGQHAGKVLSDSVTKATGGGKGLIPTKGMTDEGDRAGSSVAGSIAKGLGKVSVAPLQAVGSALQSMGRQAANVGGAMAIAFAGFAVEAGRTAMRAGEMDAALGAIAKSTGMSKAEMDAQVKTVRETGVTMSTAQGLVAQFARSQLDMGKATDVARVAQDLAILTQQNSSETLDELLYGIQTGNSSLNVFRQLNINASDAQATFAQSLGKSTQDLTQQEKQQALMNAVIEAGIPIQGTYAAAMEEPGKVLRSFPRLFDDAKLALGEGFLPAIKDIIVPLYAFTKELTSGMVEGGKFYPIVKALQDVISGLLEPVAKMAKAMADWIKQVPTGAVEGFAGAIKDLGPLLPAIAGMLATFAGKNILGAIPVVGDQLGALVGKLGPVNAGLIGLVIGLPGVREAFGELLKSLAPVISLFSGVLKDILLQVSGLLSETLTEAFKVLIPVIQNLIPPILSVVRVLGDALLNAIEAVAPIIPLIAKALADVLKGVGPLLPQLAKLAAQLIDLAVKVVVPLIPPLLEIAQIFFNILTKALGAILPPLLKMVPMLVKLGETVGKFLANALKQIAPLLENLGEFFVAILDALMPLLPPLLRIAIVLVDLAIKVITPLLPPLLKLADALLGMGMKIIPPLLKALEGLLPVFELILKVISPVIEIVAKLVGWFVQLIAKILGGSPGIIPAVQLLGSIFSAVWNAIKAVVEFVWNSVLQPIFNAIMSVFRAVGDAIMWVWNNVIKVAWDALKALFDLYWRYYLKPILDLFQAVFRALGDAIMWVWQNIIKRAWDLLKSALETLWNSTIRPIFKFIGDAWNSLGAGIKWVWDNVIKRAWDLLSSALTGVRNLFDTVTSFIARIWETMASTIKTIYQNTIQWAFDKIGDALKGIRNAFESAVDFIGTVWEKLGKVVGTPVKFVIDKVINPLLKGANVLLDKIGLSIPTIDSSGIPSFAKGGRVPGGWGGGDRQLIMAEPGEWVLTKRQARAFGYGNLRQLPHYQGGGEVGGELHPTPRFGLGDILDGVKSVGGSVLGGITDIFNAATGLIRWVAFQAFEKLTIPLREILQGMEKADVPPDFFKQVMGKFGLLVLDKTLEFIKGKSESEPEYFGGGGMGVDDIVKTIQGRFPSLRVTSALRPGDKGYHGRNLARDLASDVNTMRAAGQWIQENLMAMLLEGIHNPTLSVKNGKIVPSSFWGGATWAGHLDHIHVASEAGIGGVAAGPGGAVERWRPVVQQAFALWGMPVQNDWVNGILQLIKHESGGNPNAINNWDINAKRGTPSQGLMQTIWPTFQAYKHPSTANSMTDPLANIAAGINYIWKRYGGIFNLAGYKSIMRGGKWIGYDSGGWLPPGATLAINNTGQPEPILTRGQWDAMQTALEGGNSAEVVALLRRIARAAENGQTIQVDGREIARIVDKEMAWTS